MSYLSPEIQSAAHLTDTENNGHWLGGSLLVKCLISCFSKLEICLDAYPWSNIRKKHFCVQYKHLQLPLLTNSYVCTGSAARTAQAPCQATLPPTQNTEAEQLTSLDIPSKTWQLKGLKKVKVPFSHTYKKLTRKKILKHCFSDQ